MIFTGRVPDQEEIYDKIENISSEKIFRFLGYRKSKRTRPTEVPLKDDLDPIDMSRLGLLPNIWLAEVPSVGRPVYRLGGEQITDVFGRSLRGASVDELFDSKTADRVANRWHRMVTENLASVGWGVVYPQRTTFRVGERLILPARDESSSKNFVIGLTDYRSEVQDDRAEHAERVFDTSIVYFVPIDRL